MTESVSPIFDPIWVALGNVIEERAYGEGGAEIRSGTKHFKAGAKVYVIDAYWGMCDNVIVIGRHRKTVRFMKLVIPARHLENLRLKLLYEPSVITMIKEHYGNRGYGKDVAEKICADIPLWPR
jgi:hypothetical protein